MSTKGMTQKDKYNYHNIIRQMIKDENEIRNQRTNWFLVIQGFLIAGYCELLSKQPNNIDCFMLGIIVIGVAASIAFRYAAWRSQKATDMALTCWDTFLETYGFKVKQFPPICLFTNGVIKLESKNNDNIGCYEWNNMLHDKMYPKNRGCRLCWDSKWNKMDFLMPFKSIPTIFLLFWLFALFLYFREHYCYCCVCC